MRYTARRLALGRWGYQPRRQRGTLYAKREDPCRTYMPKKIFLVDSFEGLFSEIHPSECSVYILPIEDEKECKEMIVKEIPEKVYENNTKIYMANDMWKMTFVRTIQTAVKDKTLGNIIKKCPKKALDKYCRMLVTTFNCPQFPTYSKCMWLKKFVSAAAAELESDKDEENQ